VEYISLNAHELSLLFLGAVKPYKNIELLIDVIKSLDGLASLRILGKPVSKMYENELRTLVKDVKNVSLDLKFVEDSALAEELANCDLLVLPYDVRSSLNSGTVILAFSYKKTVICPSIGTTLDIDNTEEIFFPYTYNTKEEHFDVLRDIITKASFLKKADRYIYKAKGEECFNVIKTNNNIQDVIDDLYNLYSQI
jgi:glycosyltransferase involved in cell wall biosynthesis